ncbi:MAG: hypothetical protein ABIG44_13260 [Planctomycetota bacterium]
MHNNQNMMGKTVCISLAVVWLIIGGCPQTGSTNQTAYILPAAIPAIIQHVIDHRDTFVFNPADPLGDVVAGTEQDPLAQLDGCWASYFNYAAPADTGTIKAGEPLLDTYESYHFDAAAGTIEYVIYQEDVLGTVAIFAQYTGTYTVTDPGQLRADWQKLTFSDPETGQTIAHEATPGEEIPSWDYRVTLSGDQLRIIHDSDVEAGDGVSAEDLEYYERRVFERFSCL